MGELDIFVAGGTLLVIAGVVSPWWLFLFLGLWLLMFWAHSGDA